MNILVPSKKLYYWIFLLSLLATIVTANLVYLHFKPEGVGSVCNLNNYWNCDRINKSTFAELFGAPVSILGMAFYIFLSLNIFGVIRRFNYRKYYPINSTWLVRLAALGVIGTAIILGGTEFSLYHYSLPLQIYAVIKSIVLVCLTSWLYYKSISRSEIHKFISFLTILTLGGFIFSFYLSHIELLVLEGICIFCLAQQALIFLILIFLFLAQFYHSKSSHA